MTLKRGSEPGGSSVRAGSGMPWSKRVTGLAGGSGFCETCCDAALAQVGICPVSVRDKTLQILRKTFGITGVVISIQVDSLTALQESSPAACSGGFVLRVLSLWTRLPALAARRWCSWYLAAWT